MSGMGNTLGESWGARGKREVIDGVIMVVVHCRPSRAGKGLTCRSESNISTKPGGLC